MSGQIGQVSIPRVGLMPDQPAPYNLRDWKEVALQYDSFLYDVTKTGTHLPLCFLNSAGVNYPGMPSFRLHTYVGTNSPFGNEAINVLPSLVGASLIGADKSSQFGKNWVLMSQDFFNKANGEYLYLNNPATSSGQDWWYDLMPNVYFQQLYDLYPGIGGEADWQFTTIAARLLEALGAMGAGEAPWQVPYMNYRGWKFKTMEPNATGVPEPEAAGAFAWLLYNTWKKTGSAEHLKGAEWALEFLDSWSANPSYELQLPYGTLTAARMNAELNTKYDVEKMLNWSFEKGELRGWGTIVGNWNGFDVSGLVGEAFDAGNDYAFQMNGMQHAAALVPLVRYDKRFARAVGKWVLNLSNASRLFYPGFLPSNLQDGSAWSNLYDPGKVIGHESMRQQWQGLSPYVTGDAVNGGWAATNLALYGTSSVGYLGAMVEKTNVDKILKLDLLKTDFYGDAAYPTYLFFNPYGLAKTIDLEVGDTPVDLYEALAESFIQSDVAGTVTFTIPAGHAMMVVLCPTNGTISYDKNKLLINGVVVDYDQHQQAYTLAPRFKALAAADTPLEVGNQTSVYATVDNPSGSAFSFTWSASSGTLSSMGATAAYTGPEQPGTTLITCIVTDSQGKSDTLSVEVPIVEEINDAPKILDIQKSTPYTTAGQNIQLSCLAEDENGDPLTYTWQVGGGVISGTGSEVEWTAPSAEGIYPVSVKASDDAGLFAIASTNLLVKDFAAGAGDLIAYYPFTGNTQDESGNQLHGQAGGAVPATDYFGIPQRAYFFPGGNQNISVANKPILNFQSGITVSCWFKPNALPEKETFLLSHGSWQNRWKVSITPDKKIRWTVNTVQSIGDLDGLENLVNDSFYHLAVTYDGSLMAIYIDGELHNFRHLSGPIRTSTSPFLMGQMLPGETGYNYNGVLDEVRIFDHALSPEQVNQLYQGAITSVAEHAEQAAELIAFPNPSSSSIWVKVPGEEGEEVLLTIFDPSGKTVYSRFVETGMPVALAIEELRQGFYIITCRGEQHIHSGRFVKK